MTSPPGTPEGPPPSKVRELEAARVLSQASFRAATGPALPFSWRSTLFREEDRGARGSPAVAFLPTGHATVASNNLAPNLKKKKKKKSPKVRYF